MRMAKLRRPREGKQVIVKLTRRTTLPLIASAAVMMM